MVIVSRAEVKGKEFVHGLNNLIDGSDRPREKGKSWFSDAFSEFCSREPLLQDLYVLPWCRFTVEFEVEFKSDKVAAIFIIFEFAIFYKM